MNPGIVIMPQIMCRSDTLCYLGIMINPAKKLKASHISFIAVFSFSFINIIIFQIFGKPKRILNWLFIALNH